MTRIANAASHQPKKACDLSNDFPDVPDERPMGGGYESPADGIGGEVVQDASRRGDPFSGCGPNDPQSVVIGERDWIDYSAFDDSGAEGLEEQAAERPGGRLRQEQWAQRAGRWD